MLAVRSEGSARKRAANDVVVLWVCIALVELVLKHARLTLFDYVSGSATGAAFFIIHMRYRRDTYYRTSTISVIAAAVAGTLIVVGLLLVPREVCIAFGAGYTACWLAGFLRPAHQRP